LQKAKVDQFLEADLALQDIRAELSRCIQCGQCTFVCPSGRHGGIRVREVMERALGSDLDLSTDQEIWKCTMCHSCSERCQSGADPAAVFTILRMLASLKGNRPQHLIEEARLLRSTGMSFPRTGMTKKMRKDLGLPEGEISAETLSELQRIIDGTKMGRARLE